MSNNASIPPSSSNSLGSIENTSDENIEPFYFVESDEVEDIQQKDESEEEQGHQKEGPEEETSLEVSNTTSAPPTDLLQKRIEQFKGNQPKSKEEFHQRSYQIFAKLNACVKGNDPNIVKDSKKQQISLIASEYVDLVHEYTITAKLIPLWDLSNLLYFNTEDSNLINDLNDWINEHDPILDYTEDEEYDEGQKDYSWAWETARRHLLRGNFVEAIDTLEIALSELDEADSIAVNKIIKLVEKFDILHQEKQYDHAYAEKWTDWHEACEAELQKFMRARDEGFKEIDDEIRIIYSILAGVEQDIFISGTYFERVLGSILYARPDITMSGLHHLAQHAVYNDKSVDECAHILMGCFDDALEADNDLWLQTHLGHALIAVGAKTSNVPVDNSRDFEDQEAIVDPIYYCIDAYSTEIAEKYNMWTEAVVYLSACVENKEIWTKKLLGDPPLEFKDTSLLKSILDVAEQQNMPAIQKYIHRALGQRHEKNKDIKQATIEYGKAQDVKSLDRFAHNEFNQYLKTGKLQNVVTDMEELKASPHYTILITYQQFKAHLEKKDWEVSFRLLLDLLSSENLPSKFETVLLVDNLVILEDSKKYYDATEMLHLLKIFKQITKQEPNEAFFGQYYKHVYHQELSGSIVVAKLRERMAYETATAAAR